MPREVESFHWWWGIPLALSGVEGSQERNGWGVSTPGQSHAKDLLIGEGDPEGWGIPRPEKPTKSQEVTRHVRKNP